MRVLSFFLTLILHISLALFFFGASFAPKMRVDLNKKVYSVVLLQENLQKKNKPVLLKEKVKIKKPLVAAPKQETPKTKKNVVEIAKQKEQKRQNLEMQKKAKEAAQKAEEKRKIEEAQKAAQKQAQQAKLKKVLGEVSEVLETKQPATDEEKLASVLADLQKTAGESFDRQEGRAMLVEIYGEQVKTRIQKNWRWPGFYKQVLTARVVVTLSSDGKITARRLAVSSGRADFDSSVLRAIDETKDLPLPPQDLQVLELNFSSDEQEK